MNLLKARKRFLPLAVAALLLLLLVPVAQAWPFGDVPVGHWAYNSIQRVAYLHITAGCGDGSNYCPDDYVTRAQMAGFLNNMTKAWTDQDEPYIISVDHQYQNSNRPAIVGRARGGNAVEGRAYGGDSLTDSGVYGETNSTDTLDAGVYGRSTGPGCGVYGYSASGRGVYGSTNVSGGYGLYTNDKIYTGGGCVGCTSLLVAQNGGDATLEPGDVVGVVGIAKAPSEFYARPILLVRQADGQSSQGVVGVVEGRYATQLKEEGEVEKVMVEDAHTTTEPAAPGELLTVIYRGIAQVKVDAASGAIQVGDSLVSANASGRATKASATEAVPTGAVIGKALEALAKGQGLVWVLVDLQ